MEKYLIAHDLGTSVNKASLITTEGIILRTHSVGYPVHHKLPGWAEQDPNQWWDAFCECNSAILQGIDINEVAGISLTGQMMCCLPVASSGKVLYPAIIWADRRAEEESLYLSNSFGVERYYQTTGMRNSPNYTLPKIMWLKKHFPEVYNKTYKFISPKDYINYRLTGRFCTDPESAAYMHCLDWRTKQWSGSLLEIAEIDEEKMPEIMPSSTIIGFVSQSAAKESMLRAGLPVVMGIGDGGATTLGTAVLEPGEAYTSLGTSSWVCVITGKTNLDPQRSFSKLNYLGTTRDSGTMQAGGYSFEWMKNTLCEPELELARRNGDSVYTHIEQKMEQSAPGARGILFLPYLLGERSPFWDPKLKAAFLGIGAQASRIDLCRSVMEGVTMHLKLIFERIRDVNEPIEISSMKLVGGGAKNLLWRQIFADIYNMPIQITLQPEQAGTLGTAVLAGVGLGIYSDISVIRQFQKTTEIIYPIPENVSLYSRLFEIFIDSQKVMTEINHRLTELEL